MEGALLSIPEPEQPMLLCGHCKAVFRSGFSRCPTDGHELAPLVDDPFVGQVFAGRYAIEAFVGQGAMGRVYQARHTRMSKKFAVKIMFGDLTGDATMRARFQAEAEAASRLDHPHVVSVVDFGDTVGGIVYMVMDFVEGASLSRVLEANGPLPEARVRTLLRQIALGLQHAHERGLVHRDLKTDNVVVVNIDGRETARIIDFGIAMFADGAAGPGKLTAVGVVIGTPAYMSPEQACGEKIDHRSDLFSLGIMAYEMLAGKKPFDGHPFEIARQNIAATPPAIAERAPGVAVHPAMEALVLKLMAKAREDRFQSAQALVEAIDAIDAGGGLPVELAPATPLPRGRSIGARPAASAATIVDLSAERATVMPASPRRKKWLLYGLAGTVVLSGAMWWRAETGGAGDIAPVPDPSPMGDVVALEPRPSPLPAEVLTAAPDGDSTITIEPSPGEDPDEPAEASPAPSNARRRRTIGDRRARITLEDEPEIPASQLSNRVRQVTDLLNTVSKARGEKFMRPYEERLKHTHSLYAQALRDPSKRRQVFDELERLSAELAKLR